MFLMPNGSMSSPVSTIVLVSMIYSSGFTCLMGVSCFLKDSGCRGVC